MSLFKIFKNKKDSNNNTEIISPINGELLDLDSVPDDVFSKKIMGDGFAFKSNDGIIVSPINGTVEMIFDTKHAIGIKGLDDKEILIHLGIDTVNLKGEGFKVFVKEGDKIKAGQKLIEMNIDFVSKNAKSDISPVIFTNLKEDEKISLTKGNVTQLEKNRIFIENK